MLSRLDFLKTCVGLGISSLIGIHPKVNIEDPDYILHILPKSCGNYGHFLIKFSNDQDGNKTIFVPLISYLDTKQLTDSLISIKKISNNIPHVFYSPKNKTYGIISIPPNEITESIEIKNHHIEWKTRMSKECIDE